MSDEVKFDNFELLIIIVIVLRTCAREVTEQFRMLNY